jgi:hypothetical protein
MLKPSTWPSVLEESPMTLALVLFGLAAAGGLTLAYLRFKEKDLPFPLALLHGAGAAAGLVALVLVVMRSGAPGQARLALILFGVAALGGFTLFFGFYMRKKVLPIGVVVAHGLVAIAAFVVLLLGVLKAG